jgi:hypothetical protein
MKKSKIIRRLSTSILAGFLVFACIAVYADRNSPVHKKIQRGTLPDACYCTGPNVCVMAPSGFVSCGNVIDCSTHDSQCNE